TPFYSLDDRAFTSHFDVPRRTQLWPGGRDFLRLFHVGYEGASPDPIARGHCGHAIHQRLSDQSMVHGSLFCGMSPVSNEYILYTLAQVATTLAGFSGLVVIFRVRGAQAWSRAELRTFWFLLGDSF